MVVFGAYLERKKGCTSRLGGEGEKNLVLDITELKRRSHAHSGLRLS